MEIDLYYWYHTHKWRIVSIGEGNSKGNDATKCLKLQEVFERSPLGIILLSPLSDSNGDIYDFVIRDVNNSAIVMCHLPSVGIKNNALGDVSSLWHDTLLKPLSKVATTGKSNTIRGFCSRCGGNKQILDFNMFEASDMIVVFVDKSQNDVSSQGPTTIQTQELEERNEEMQRLVYNVSHDLKSPLNALQGMTNILYEDFHEVLGKEGSYYIERIKANSDKMGMLINDLLKFSRTDRNDFSKERIDVSELVQEIISSCSAKYPIENLSITVSDALPTIIFVCPYIYEVFDNVIRNAFMYMGDQKSPAIEVGYDSSEECHTFYVKDNGVGINPKNTEKIFKVFERLYDTDTKGTGIGLALTKRILSNNKGNIWVKSKKGQGSTFYFTIPKEEGNSNEI